MDRVFAIMPFGKQKSHYKRSLIIDFDSVYNKAIKPACEECGLKIIRADEEIVGGIIHTLMFERLVCSNIAIVDISNQNPNVYYELGFRHCARDKHTIIIFNKDSKLPFDIFLERAIPYKLNGEYISEECANELKNKIIERLNAIKTSKHIKDSPAFELIDSFPLTTLQEEKLQLYIQKQDLYESITDRLNSAKNVTEINDCINTIKGKEQLSLKVLTYCIIENFKRLANTNKKDSWTPLIDFISSDDMCDLLSNSIHIQQQLAIAYNKRDLENDKEKSLKILNNIIDCGYQNSETYGLIGSVYKTLYEQEKDSSKKEQLLDLSIENYRKGFNMDITDYYPGINLANLLFKKYYLTNDDYVEKELASVLEILKYDVNLLLKDFGENYWLLATCYELDILSKDFEHSKMILDKLVKLNIKNPIADWQKDTTLKNLTRIKNIYATKKYQVDWYEDFKNKLKVREEK